MKSPTILFALVLFGATSFGVCAQTAPTPTEETDTDIATAPTSDAVDRTGTSTETAIAPTDVEEGAGHTGPDTRTLQQVEPTAGHTGPDTRSGPSPWTLSAPSSSISSPGSNTVAVTMPANAEASGDASYTVPLSSSVAACTVPASVVLDWTPSAGGSTSFQVDCAKVSKRTTVTITGGTATTSFTLKP
jgi:hypothetical protein